VCTRTVSATNITITTLPCNATDVASCLWLLLLLLLWGRFCVTQLLLLLLLMLQAMC
jgi:hypothetical protein